MEVGNEEEMKGKEGGTEQHCYSKSVILYISNGFRVFFKPYCLDALSHSKLHNTFP